MSSLVPPIIWQLGKPIIIIYSATFHMTQHILFIQGGGDNGYEADAKLAASLQTALGRGYEVHYPKIVADMEAPDFGWLRQIDREFSAMESNLIVVAHSFGASILLKYLSENKITRHIHGIFLLATPFWNGEEDWQQGFKLQNGFAERLPKEVPIFLYHCRDDDECSIDHLSFYAKMLPHATISEIPAGGHQFNNDLAFVATDIRALSSL